MGVGAQAQDASFDDMLNQRLSAKTIFKYAVCQRGDSIRGLVFGEDKQATYFVTVAGHVVQFANVVLSTDDASIDEASGGEWTYRDVKNGAMQLSKVNAKFGSKGDIWKVISRRTSVVLCN